YLAHPILGPRLLECTRLVLAVENRTIHAILGSPDDLKFRSSMTLFSAVCDDPVFDEAIAKYYAGAKDQPTLDLLRYRASFMKSGGRRSANAVRASRASAVFRRSAKHSLSAAICAASASALRIRRLVVASAPTGCLASLAASSPASSYRRSNAT